MARRVRHKLIGSQLIPVGEHRSILASAIFIVAGLLAILVLMGVIL